MARARRSAPPLDGRLLESFSEVVDGIYAAALRPALWPGAMGLVARLHRCPAAHLLTPVTPPEDGGFAFSHGLEGVDASPWAHCPRDPAAPRPASGAWREDHVFLSDEEPPAAELESTYFYREYLARIGVGSGGFCAGVVFDGARADCVATACSFFSGRGAPALTERDKHIHRLTIRHLSRALGTMYRLRDSQRRLAASLAALDRLPGGVLLFDERGDVVFANAAALALLRMEDGLRLRAVPGLHEMRGRLAAQRPDDDRRLQEATREACAMEAFPRAHFSQGVAVRRPSGRRPFTLQLSALAPDNELSHGPREARAIGFLAEPDVLPRLDAALLERAYGLTPAECALAQEVMSGGALEALASRLRVSGNTAKSQLQSIFHKTGTHRQAELVGLLLGLASAVPGGRGQGAVTRSGDAPRAPSTLTADPGVVRRADMRADGIGMMSVMVVLAVALPSRAAPAVGPQGFPERPTTLTVGFAPGGATDTFARIVARKLADNIGQPVIVENKPGGSGTTAWKNLMNAAPDGYTLHIGGVEGFAVSSITQPDLPYHPVRDFAPVIMGAVSPIIYVVHADVPAASLQEFVALAKQRPGSLTYASPGVTTTNHLAGALLAIRAGIDLLHVPYKGGGPAMVDVLGGRVAMYPAQIPTSKQHVEAGKLRALATAGATRSALMPAVPTVAEQGYPEFEVKTSYAFFASSKVPAERLDYWNRELARVLADPGVVAELAKQGLEPAPGSREALGRYLASEMERWGGLIREKRIKLD